MRETKQGIPKRIGWWEEYNCGCVSETVKRKKALGGYCPKHGDDRRHVHPDYKFVSPSGATHE